MADKTVLLVDDSGTSLMLEKLILSQNPYQMLTARDGEEAVTTALAERPDLILLDVVMPKMDGFAACERLKAEEATRAIPVILVTTRGEAESVERGFALGCSDYVTKPLNSLELLTKIRNCLGA